MILRVLKGSDGAISGDELQRCDVYRILGEVRAAVGGHLR